MAAFADTTVLANAGTTNESECASSLKISLEASTGKGSVDDSATTAPALPIVKGLDELTLCDNVTPDSVVLDSAEAAGEDDGETEFSHKMFQRHIEDFKCEHCGERVSGNGYTNRKTRVSYAAHLLGPYFYFMLMPLRACCESNFQGISP